MSANKALLPHPTQTEPHAWQDFDVEEESEMAACLLYLGYGIISH